MMKRILTITTALCLVAGAAHAGGTHEQPHGQPATVTGQQSQGQLQGQRQAQGQRQVANGGSATAQGGSGGAGGNTGPVTVNNTTGGGSGGGYSYSARGNTPDVILGSVSGGNPCGLGAGVAGAGGGGGGGGGGLTWMWEGDGCETREGAKLLHNLGYSMAAKNRLCQDTRYSKAFADAGQPCSADVQRWQAEWIKAGYRPDPRNPGYWVR